MSLGITGIDHVQIAAPRALEAATLRFYRDVLGLTEIPKPAELQGRGGAWFQTDNLQMHIGIDPEGSDLKSKRHICFLVSDLSAAKAQLQVGGIAIEEESVADGLARFFIRDPAGNRVEIGHR
jgi:catechol 2,3-dioxygenase-like lactoylglutathione lyase family enzyme